MVPAAFKSSLVVLVVNAKTTSGPDRATLEFPRYNASVHFLESIPKAGEEDRSTRNRDTLWGLRIRAENRLHPAVRPHLHTLTAYFQSQGNVKWRYRKVDRDGPRSGGKFPIQP
jgi:hypothetical protein